MALELLIGTGYFEASFNMFVFAINCCNDIKAKEFKQVVT
jgi:hypothetical protein